MDQKLLNALNNIGFALEELVDAINSKSEAKTATGSAIQSGDFGADLKSINEGIKSIKADTQTIIKNQQTIIAQGKERESAKTKDIETDPKKESDIKKGVGTILLIAVAVLAIGLAFKLVGEIDVLSVMGLALGITLVAIAFEKVAQLKLGIEDATITSAVMVIASLGLMVSSYVLNLVTPVSPAKMITAILISAGFALLGPSIAKLVEAFKGMSFVDLVKTVIFLPIILPAISLSIAITSEFLQKVQPIGLSQFISSILISAIFVVLSYSLKNMISAFSGINPALALVAALFLPTILVSISQAIADSSQALSSVKMMTLGSFFGAILISIIFVVLSYGIKNIIKSFQGIDPATAAIAAISAPILLVAMSYAIWKSSELLSNVIPITLDKFITSLGISIVFIGLSFAASQIIKKLQGLSPATIASAVIAIPILMVAMSGAIMASSYILDKMTVLSEDKLINAGLIGAGLSLISIAMTPSIKVLSQLSLGDVLKGALIIPILATAIMISSLILDIGEYKNYPGLGWVAGVSLSLLTFGLGALALGIAVFGPQALVFAAGLAAIIGVAGTIVAVSSILKNGKYDNPGMLNWAVATSLLFATFTPVMLVLGAAALASTIISAFGPNPWEMAKTAIEDVAKTIVSASVILSDGYVDKNGTKVKPNYKSGPTKEWAESIAIALGAFSPVYGMLMKNSLLSFLGIGGVGPDDFATAITTVSQGIITAAKFFASPENPGVWKGGPTKEWAEGVGTAIGAFAPVYEILAANSGWFKSGVRPEDFAGEFDDNGKLVKPGAIQVIARGIVSAAKFFAENVAPFSEGNYPSKGWSEGVGAALNAFSPVFDMLMNKSFWKSSDSVINSMVKGIISTTRAITRVAAILHVNSKFFTTTIDPNYVKTIRQNILDFNSLVQELSKSQGEEGVMSKVTNSILGTDPITKIARQMVTLAKGYDKLSDSLIKLSGAMKLLNISDIRMLGDINPNMEVQSGKVTGSQKPTNSVNLKKGGDSPMVSNKVGIGKKGETTMKQDIEEIVKILSSIDKNSGESNTKLGDMLRKLSDESVKIAKAGS